MKKLLTILALAALLPIVLPIPVRSQQTGEVNKTPFEAADLSIDFTQRLCPDGTSACAPSGITLSSVVATNLGTNKDNTPNIIVLSPDTPVPAVFPSSDVVVFRVKGGFTGENYNLGVRVIKVDTGEKLEGNILLHIVRGQ